MLCGHVAVEVHAWQHGVPDTTGGLVTAGQTDVTIQQVLVQPTSGSVIGMRPYAVVSQPCVCSCRVLLVRAGGAVPGAEEKQEHH
jgi:hypothetical protein